MASGSTIQNSLSAKLMVLLLILPIISLHKTLDMSESEESLADVTGEYTTQALSDFNLEYGYDIAGEHIDFADINQGHVRFESDLDLAHNQVLQSASTGTVIATDVALSKQQEINACWVNLEGSVHYYWADRDGATKTMAIDEILGSSEGINTADCAIAVKDNGRASALYTNGSDVKAGQIAYASSLYVEGDDWHTRTILEDVNPTNIELAITPEYFEYGVFRDDNGALHRVNYTGAFWQTGLIDSGPVGEDFELEIGSNGDVYLMYTKANQAILQTVSDGHTTNHVVAESVNLHHDLGFTLDDSGLIQLFSSTLEDNLTTITIERSLANQANQISSNPVQTFISDLADTTFSAVLFADFNGDGFDDLATSESGAGTQGLDSNGRVSVRYGSQSGLSPTVNLSWEGATSMQMLGNGIAVGDYNGDGFDDLAIGSPGAASNDGLVQFAFGSSAGLDVNLVSISGVSNPVASGERFGYSLETVADLNLDGNDELLVCAIDHELGSDSGKVELFFGGSSTQTWSKQGSPDQLLQGSNFGQSISADGDLNGDGFADLVIGNTGDLTDSSGFSSVEIRYGSSSGYAAEPDRAFQSILAGVLFGYHVQIVNDLNADGYDELLISEPYNTSGPFNSGNVWVFYGSVDGISSAADARLVGSANDLLGLNFMSAGDTNSDGYNDMLITRSSSQTQSKVELMLGSTEILDGSAYFVAAGAANFGQGISNFGDSNTDGLAEYVFTSELSDNSQSTQAVLESYSRKLFDVSVITLDGETSDGKIQSSSNGHPTIVVDVENATDSTGSTKMISLERNAESSFWSLQDLTNVHESYTTSTNFELTSSGSPYVMIAGDGLRIKTYTGYTGVETTITPSSADIEHLVSAETVTGDNYLAYYSPFENRLYFNNHTDSGWTEEVVSDGANISTPISLLVNNTGSPIIVYRDSANQQLKMASHDVTWSVTNLTSPGTAIAASHSGLIDSSDRLMVSAMINDGNFNNLTVITKTGSTIDTTTIAVESDLNTNLSLLSDDAGGFILAAFTSAGSLIIYEKASESATWNSVLLPQPQQIGQSNTIASISGDTPIIAVNSEVNSVFAKLSTGWEVIAHSLGNKATEFFLLNNTTHLFVLSKSIDSLTINWNSLEFAPASFDNSWHSSSITESAAANGLSASITGDVVGLYVKSPSLNLISNIKFYPDTDSDHIFDAIDDLPNTPNQWSDQDGDGYGDNPMAPLSDDCSAQSGTSSILVLGCFDADGDGYDDLTDDCNTAFGASWLGRFGCTDFDQDGWVDWNSLYPFGDIFSDNWKQAFDSDGDSYGDNHGPDCCDTWYDDNAPPGDEFPFDAKQYADYDGDGYGDNSSDFIGGDACKFDFGTSFRDRLGCIDTDGDGASDPTTLWNASLGADIWPNDATQWSDSDGDGYGDNGSKNATNPDYFPNNIAAANDSDEDGYPDVFTEFYNGTNAQGLQIDGCPLVAGNSTNPFYGCLDTDGDNYRDIYSFDVNPTTGLRENQSGDAFPFDANQWSDTDGDGFGDFQGGELADVCPNAPGVFNGTLGIGCPLIDGNDDDGDFVINENDVCPDTEFGLLVDLAGCAENQLDGDSDGVTNDIDICPNTEALAPVDENGCSEAQRQIDTDSDGVYDYLDLCDDTLAGEIPDLDGCALSQKDTDSDGITDDIDVCPDTPENYPVLADGCTDESAKDVDWDEDGYTGDDDLFMFEPTQWADSDGDGYGDNSQGFNGDQCPSVSGTSALDRLGCLDSDQDGYSDPTPDFAASPSGLADAFTDDITQWHDNDGDGYGDNASGQNPDFCPATNPLYRTSVDLTGCAPNERDSDDDGVVDSLDNCPNQPRGTTGYSDGCPLEAQESTSQQGQILGISINMFIGIVAGIVVLLMAIIVILRRRNLDDDDWYEDDDEEEDFIEDRLAFLDRNQSTRNQPQQSGTVPLQPTRAIAPLVSGPTAPPNQSFNQQQTAPKTKIPSSGPPQFATNLASQRAKLSSKKVAKKVKKSETNDKKVRRAVVEIEEDIFENVATSSIDNAVSELGNITNENERELLMRLQEQGWNAPQSRAIINLAKTKSR